MLLWRQRCMERSMSPHRGYILVCENVEERAAKLQEELRSKRVVNFVKEKFLVEDAKAAIAEAYISEEEEKYILIGAEEFNVYAQNTLLKILEEPPKNIIFILLSPSKSTLLPTIRSRMPIQKEGTKKGDLELDISLKTLDLQAVFEFLSKHKNVTKSEAKEIVEALYKKALSEGLVPSEAILENFDTAYRLLELNSRASVVFSFLLMGFLHEN